MLLLTGWRWRSVLVVEEMMVLKRVLMMGEFEVGQWWEKR
jgi:hypothetical protein